MGMALGIIGAGVSAVGSLAAASERSAMDAYQAAVAKQNAEFAVMEGEAKATDQGLKGASAVAAATTDIAARGIDITQGSPLAVIASGRRLSLLDSDTIRSDAAREAYGYQTQAVADQYAAKSEQTAGIFGAFGNLFGGLSNLAGYGPGGSLIGGAVSPSLAMDPAYAGAAVMAGI